MSNTFFQGGKNFSRGDSPPPDYGPENMRCAFKVTADATDKSNTVFVARWVNREEFLPWY